MSRNMNIISHVDNIIPLLLIYGNHYYTSEPGYLSYNFIKVFLLLETPE